MNDLEYKCDCGHVNPCESGWAAAHWHEELLHTCKGCGNRNAIKDGEWLMTFEVAVDD